MYYSVTNIVRRRFVSPARKQKFFAIMIVSVISITLAYASEDHCPFHHQLYNYLYLYIIISFVRSVLSIHTTNFYLKLVVFKIKNKLKIVREFIPIDQLCN
nr:putative chemosensory protein 8 [Corcyra cephalonica]